MTKLTKILTTATASFALFACTASAATHTFTIDLTTDQASVKTGSGSGSGTASYDDATGDFSWDFTYTVGGMVTAGHFHGPAAPGDSAGIEVPLPMASDSPNIGMVMITPAQGTDLINGLWYVNIHTDDVVSGEIRGQLVNDNPPVDNTAEKKSLGNKIKKLKKKIKKATGPKGKKLKKKLKKLKKKLKNLS